MTIKKPRTARMPNTFAPRRAAVAVICMLVLAGHGASQATTQDDKEHILRGQVEAALEQQGVDVPRDLQFLVEPTALDALAAYYAHALSNGQGPWDASAILLLLRQGLHENPVLADHPEAEHIMDGVDEDVQELLDALKQPTGMCMHDGFDYLPEVGLLAGPSCLLLKAAGPALVIATIVLAIVAPIAVEGAKIVLYLDDNGDEIGDDWGDYWKDVSSRTSLVDDWDSDELGNIREFRWELYPICVGALPDDPRTQLVDESLLTSDNCTDYDDDNWRDGPEVAYWNNPENDAVLSEDGVAFLDPDRLMDEDDDTLRNTYDPDSDDDDLQDGDEIMVGSYPEYADSDCDVSAPVCTASWDTSYYDTTRVGSPGTRDGINDAEELAYWNTISTSAWQTKYDDDNIASNLLDPDSDGDTLLDGEEILVHNTKPYSVDSDIDGLTDDVEVRIHATDPNHWDSDGDSMPDWWEVEYHLNPNVNDANQDGDRDGLSNVQEYRYARPGGWDEATDGAWTGGTNPIDPDTEGDGLFDGPEVLDHETDPFWWDTDSDGLPDAWEVDHGLQPLVNDAIGDPDADFFDQGNDGSIEQTWTNLQEYQYGRPDEWSEELTGPWPGGTDPRDPDTDDDTAKDGQEVYFGTDPRVNNQADPSDAINDIGEVLNDDDKDGLNWTEEASLGTNPIDPDTDGDGLCDGGHAENCVWSGVGFQPGEGDYGSTPWSSDSDGDGLSDFAEVEQWDPGRSGNAADTDGDLLNGVIDADNDDDGLLDGQEPGYGTLMEVPDSDGDGIRDGDEVHIHGTSPTDEDSDGDLLTDGAELQARTDPRVEDSDGDGLLDGEEVATHGTDPNAVDSDGDTLPDAWEVSRGTQPRTPDAGVDADGDGLTNRYEYEIDSLPVNPDSDGDGLLDGWEDRYGTGVLVWSASGDPDGDGATNLEEFQASTNPQDGDTDGDELSDGGELSAGTSPLVVDTDGDGLRDGVEVLVHGTDPLSPDTDGDGLDDFEEVFSSHTNPRDADMDNDGLSDYEEVVVYQGYKPNDPDSDDDGIRDGDEVALADPSGDPDGDRLSNSEETGTYGTDPLVADSDCDGMEDGAEVSFWDTRYPLSTYKPYLRNSDVDGDGIKDGIEAGPSGTGSHVLYRTQPDAEDTDGDGLWDGEEARNNFKPDCAPQPASASMGMESLGSGSPLLLPLPGTEGNPVVGHTSTPLPEPVAGESLAVVATDADALAGLAPGFLYEDASSGLMYGVDSSGLYVQGGYGVRLYVDLDALPESGDAALDLSDVLGPQVMGHESGVPCTNPILRDTDGDGLTDTQEQSGSRNPYKAQRHDPARSGGNTDPCAADTDGDRIGDGLELGVSKGGGALADAWVMNPNRRDTDLDGKSDDVEDVNQDGVDDLSYDAFTGVYTARQNSAGASSSPIDADTDDDGLPDGVIGSLRDPDPLKWDLDGDGLSDGLESGVTKPLVVDGIQYTITGKNVFGLSGWWTFQEFEGDFIGVNCTEPSATCDPVTTEVNLRDSDGDGIIDGLEDVNHNGKFGDFNSVLGLKELGPNVADTDNDGIVDGKELLIYGTYTFQSFVGAQGDPWTGVSYDEHVFKTDPLKPSTDADGILDGKDINPKGDGLLLLQLDTFYQYDKIDAWGPDHGTDLVLKITMETGVGDFWLQTIKLQDFGSKSGSIFDGSGIDVDEHKEPPSVTGATLKAIKMLEEAKDTIRFDLPDNIDDFAKARDLKVHVRLDAIDIDGTANGNDPVDVSAVKGDTQFYDVKGVDLSAGPLAGGHEVLLDANGNGDSVKGDQNDGRLKMNVHSNLAPYFLRNLLGTQVLEGNCLGGVTETSNPCLQ